MENQEKAPQPEQIEATKAQFEFERGTPFRKKLLITSPLRIIDDKDQEKTLDPPAVVHVQKQDLSWTWLCDDEGRNIGKASINHLDPDSTWNTRVVLKPLTPTVALYATAEEALRMSNPTQVLQNNDLVLPVMEIRMEGKVPLYRVNSGLRPGGVVGKRGWVAIRSSVNEDALFQRGTLNTESELSTVRSSIDLLEWSLRQRREPVRRGDVGPILKSAQRYLWAALTGEAGREFTQDTIRHARETIGIGALLNTSPLGLNQKSEEDMLQYLKWLKNRCDTIQRTCEALPRMPSYTLSMNGSREKMYFTEEITQ